MRGVSELDTSAQGRVPQATRTEERLVQCPSLSGRLRPREREDRPEVTQQRQGKNLNLRGPWHPSRTPLRPMVASWAGQHQLEPSPGARHPGLPSEPCAQL